VVRPSQVRRTPPEGANARTATGAGRAKPSEDRLAARLASDREQARLLGEVAQAARTIHASTSVDSVLRVISEEARRIIGAHQCVVSLTTGGDWSQAIVDVSLSDKYAGYRGYDAFPRGRCLHSLVFETKQTVRPTPEPREWHPRLPTVPRQPP